ncbi:carboxypeptidase-like regulatory domain-containing protein [Algoriphagus halophytocola]|uniref:carboxypeptidase-like regulatory domain-containing protein n=1 Tax=Algoriphagus halophytocola TaxID=2991499 RepID=UPI0022DE4BD4|nr:carboxypeptidase-like regulatory domain-containing protein [Algoriphagus sp. TR-M9]WBL44058.1 carboxypeptidase-like regulatory domain-containing protein [Algoriphagus sp. TR-M9]
MKVFLAIFTLLLSLPAFGQKLYGEIKDENANPVPYVNIGIVDLDRGTISNQSGHYEIDISGLDDEEILRFSMIGFENTEFNIGKLKSQNSTSLNITLKEKPIELKEIEVKATKGTPLILGVKKPGNFSWIWSDANKGDEIGMLFRVKNPFYLDKFSFHIKRNSCDSIYYRVKIYDEENELPIKIINQEDIRFLSTLKKGWETVDMSAYNILIESDFIISLETLDSCCSDGYTPSRLSIGSDFGLTYSRPSSMAPWLEIGNEMSFRIEGIEILDD